MGFVVLITWFAAVLMELFMLAVWLIENDVTDPGTAASRLPALVVLRTCSWPRPGSGCG